MTCALTGPPRTRIEERNSRRLGNRRGPSGGRRRATCLPRFRMTTSSPLRTSSNNLRSPLRAVFTFTDFTQFRFTTLCTLRPRDRPRPGTLVPRTVIDIQKHSPYEFSYADYPGNRRRAFPRPQAPRRSGRADALGRHPGGIAARSDASAHAACGARRASELPHGSAAGGRRRSRSAPRRPRPVVKFVVDTNVFAYAVNRDCSEHRAAMSSLQTWLSGAVPWCVTWSIVYEFLRLGTHPRVFRHPLSATQALERSE